MSPGKASTRSRTKRSSDNQTESQEMANSKASPATPSASQVRRLISQDLSGSLLESRSQAALSSELTPTRNTTKSKTHTGNVKDPLKHGKLHNFSPMSFARLPMTLNQNHVKRNWIVDPKPAHI